MDDSRPKCPKCGSLMNLDRATFTGVPLRWFCPKCYEWHDADDGANGPREEATWDEINALRAECERLRKVERELEKENARLRDAVQELAADLSESDRLRRIASTRSLLKY